MRNYPDVQLRVTRGAAPGDSDKDVDAAYNEPPPTDAHHGQPGAGGADGGGGAQNEDELVPVPSAENVEERWKTFRSFVKAKEDEGWVFDAEAQSLVLGDISIPCESPQNLETFVKQPGVRRERICTRRQEHRRQCSLLTNANAIAIETPRPLQLQSI